MGTTHFDMSHVEVKVATAQSYTANKPKKYKNKKTTSTGEWDIGTRGTSKCCEERVKKCVHVRGNKTCEG